MPSTPGDASTRTRPRHRLRLPEVPDGAVVDVPGRGAQFLRQVPGPPGAPTVVLLHGWMATADLNWGFSYRALRDQVSVVAIDLHGHGRGRRSARRFSFAGCADDVVAVLDHLGIDRAIAVGYSMGGPVALTLARRHPERVRGVVLCATAAAFSSSPLRRASLRPLGPLVRATRVVPRTRWRDDLRRRVIARRASGRWQDWIADELAPSDLTTMLEAGAALTQFDAQRWLGEIAAPAAVVVTTRDELVSPTAQRALARGLRDATVHDVDGGHVVCFEDPDAFVPVLLAATCSVAGRDG